jgi:hypothetical protein
MICDQIEFEALRDELLELVCSSVQYKEITTRLHEKYKDQMVKGQDGSDDYPEVYWTEFNPEFDKLIMDAISGTIKLDFSTK